jgi:hypothetical protein
VNAQKELKKALVTAAEEIRPEFERMVRESGWPQAVREKITLVVEEESIGVSWPPELDKKIDDLEYGTIGKTPTHLLRRIDEYIDSVVGREISKSTLGIMFSGFLPV